MIGGVVNLFGVPYQINRLFNIKVDVAPNHCILMFKLEPLVVDFVYERVGNKIDTISLEVFFRI